MAKANIDFKALSLKYGEKAGFATAGVLMVLLVFWGVTASGAALTKESIETNAKEANSAIENSRVNESKLVPKDVVTPERLRELAINVQHLIPVNAFWTRFPFFMHFPNEDFYRRKPVVYKPTKLIAVDEEFAYRILAIKDGKIMTSQKEGKKVSRKLTEKQKKERDKLKDDKRSGMPGGGGGRGGPGMPGGGMGGGMGGGLGGGMGGSKEEETTTVWRPHWVRLDELGDDLLANDIAPTRAALIVGSFPHAQQMDELAKALKWDTSRDGILPIFYKRLEVQRRQVALKGAKGPDGKPLTEDHIVLADRTMKPFSAVPKELIDDRAGEAGWTTIDIRRVAPWLRYVVEWEEETDPIRRHLLDTADRLAMNVPKPVRGSFPDLVKELPDLQSAIDKIEKEGQKNRPPPRRHRDLGSDDFDPFGPGGRGTKEESGSGGAGGGQPPAGGGGKSGDQSKSTEGEAADFCTIRFLDLDPVLYDAAGKTFEYRVRVVLWNPNFGQTSSVADPQYAKDEELAGDWTDPVRITFPQEAYVYADERPNRTTAPNDFRNFDRIPIQVHKWLGYVPRNAGVERVGEWWVDRVLAGRGEYIGRNVNASTTLAPPPPPPKEEKKSDKDKEKEEKKPPPPLPPPILNPYTASDTPLIFWVPTTPEDEKKDRTGIDFFFPRARTEELMTRYLLVDFDGGKPENRKWTRGSFAEDVPAEILVIDKDGRLVAHSHLRDKDDDTRKNRFTNWQKWFKEVESKTSKTAAKPSSGGGLFDNK